MEFKTSEININGKIYHCLKDCNGLIMHQDDVEKLLKLIRPFYERKDSDLIISLEFQEETGIDIDKILEEAEKVK